MARRVADHDIDLMIAARNPVPTVSAHLDARASADLRRILATDLRDPRHGDHEVHEAPRTHRRWGTTHLAAVAAMTAGLLIGGSVITHNGWLPGVQGEAAFAATPPLLDVGPVGGLSAYGLSVPSNPTDPVQALIEIADHVQALPPDTSSGRYAKVATQGWYLNARVDGRQVTSEVVLTATTRWVAADGSGRATTQVGDGKVEEETFGAGGRSFYWAPGSLSSDPAALSRQLETAHPPSNGPVERLVAITDLYKESPVPPAVRAAVLRSLAATPGLMLTGPVEDRAGRRGVAVHLDSDYSGLPTRYTLIIDPETGLVLGDEAMLTATAGLLNVPVPSVISYTTYLDSRFTDARD